MGVGDEIMASGHALAEHRRTGKRAQIVDLHRRPRWSEVWQGMPWIAAPGESGDFVKVQNGPQCRPYIRYPFTRQTGITFSGWRAQDNVGVLALTEAERAFAESATRWLDKFVVIEPHILVKSNPNKQWGVRRWQALADALSEYALIQIGPRGTRTLRHVRLIETPTFRLGAAVLERAAYSILPEGGLHHAAGVLNRPAIVLFGGFISPETTGYPWHVNLADEGHGSPCGRWMRCLHCARAWSRLKPKMVADALRNEIEGRRPAHQFASGDKAGSGVVPTAYPFR